MKKPKLSVILPGIRVQNWPGFYDHLQRSYGGHFELIIISPYELPKALSGRHDVVHIQDWGSPARCQQIGLTHATGELVTWGADDGYFLENKLTEAVELFEDRATSERDIVTCKYIEGEDTELYESHMETDEYYKINFSNGLRSKFIPDDFWILNVGIVNTEYAKSIGGWDSKFEVTTIAHMDFAIRTQRAGSNYIMMEEPIFVCSHMPGMSGDHAPIHIAQLNHDEPLFRAIYNNEASLSRITIELTNWENSPERWEKRFKNNVLRTPVLKIQDIKTMSTNKAQDRDPRSGAPAGAKSGPYDLSVCLAAIRKDNWERLYDSIKDSIGNYTFELIFCGPHKELPEALQGKEGVRCIVDYGAPTRAQQISMKSAKGRYITWAADDGWYYDGGLEQCIDFLDEQTDKNKKCVVTRYTEGGSDGLGEPEAGMYYINSHDPVRSEFVESDFLIFNSVILETKLFHELGGFDCRFEACPMAFVDFGARAQLAGLKPTLTGTIFECTQFPGTSGDHAPIHHAQLEHDQPLYNRIWRSSSCLERIKIDFDNWETAAPLWERRFDGTDLQES